MVISDKFGNGGHVMKIPTAMDDSSVVLQKTEVGRQPNLDTPPNIKRGDEQSQPVQYSIPGILHFIQHEWARFELERSQWEVDRAEFEARIEFLQGERKGQENLKNDLVRRIKMLEYALKQERAKFHKLKFGVELQQGDIKPPPDESITDQDIEAKMPWKQGRQLIRQYLREIGYADTILDVRSNRVRALLGLNNNSDQDDINLSLNGTDSSVKPKIMSFDSKGCVDRQFRKEFNRTWKEEDESGPDALLDGEAAVFANFEFLARQEDMDMDVLDDLDAKKSSTIIMNQNKDVDHVAKEVLNELNLYTEGDADIGGQGDDYPGGPGTGGDEPLALGELAQLTVSNEAEAYDVAAGGATKESFRKTWNAKYTLRSHFDGVRALAFHPIEPELVTASEDHTLKLWNLQRTVPAKKSASLDVEPLYTFRGHSGPVLCLAMDSAGSQCWSGGLDGTVRAWNLPPPSADPYDAFEPDALGPVLTGHTDAVWSLAQRRGKLLSAGADGTLRLWNSSASQPLIATLCSEPDGIPACADFADDGSKAVACYESSAVVSFDLETGKPVLRFGGEAGGGGSQCTSPAARVASHPVLPLTITAHDDRHVRFWDNASGRLAHAMVAHLDAVTSLAVDPNGLFLLSGSHDCSIRLWNLDTKTCVQEITAHRKKFDESILDVAFHPSRPYIASAGADSLAKVFV